MSNLIKKYKIKYFDRGYFHRKGVVSVIIPCYNCVKYISKLLESIIFQDYRFVEIFLVDDGSNDNIEELILSYIPRFFEHKYELIYLQQKNCGQSAALNHALKLISGEYLVWPDSDDWYSDNKTLSKMIASFKELPEDYAIVRCLPTFINEDTGKISRRLELCEEYEKTNQFENALFSRNIFWAPINYMIKINCFDSVNKNRMIYVHNKAGQNWQMLLPVCYSYSCYTMKCSCTCILERQSSHSREGSFSYDKLRQRIKIYWSTVNNTLDLMYKMSLEEQFKWKRLVNEKYQLELLQLAIYYYDKKEAEKYYCILKQSETFRIPKPTEIAYFILKLPLIGTILLRNIKNIRNVIKRNKKNLMI